MLFYLKKMKNQTFIWSNLRMKAAFDWYNRIKYWIYTEIDIFNYTFFTANKKETWAFHSTLQYAKRKNILEELEYSFYNYQLLIELFERFHDKMGMSDKNWKMILSSYTDLKIAYRFLFMGYYSTAGMHLRWFFEKAILGIYNHFLDSQIIQEQKSLQEQIKVCLKHGDLTCKNPNKKNKDVYKDVYNEYYFPLGEIMKLYKHYSAHYVHNGNGNTDLDFIELEFKKIYFLISISLIYIPRFFRITIWEKIEAFWTEKILNPVEEYLYYRNYLQFLFGENKIFSNQYSEIYNLLLDKDITSYLEDELGINTHNLFEPKYLAEQKADAALWKKAKWDKEKYCKLLLEKEK